MTTITRKTIVLLMIVLLFAPSCTFPTPATTVACNVPDLIKAINDANATAAADVLELASGCVYTLTAVNTTVTATFEGSTFDYGDVGLPPITTPITINGHNATITRAVDAPDFRIFHILGTGNLTLNDLTLTNGFANRTGNTFPSSGGAIYNDRALLQINRSTLQSNRAGFHGGAIFDFSNATTRITDSTIRDNTAPLGGGIFEYQSRLLSVENSSILNNTGTTEGGGINVGYGTELIISKSVISFNHSGRRGGGIFKDGDSDHLPTTISGSTFEGNTADWGGGAVFIWRSSLTISSSQFLQNQAGEYGGGLGYQNDTTETVNIRSTTFDGNTAGLDGGAIHFSGTLMKITGATFRNNTAENGGAIHNAAAELDKYLIRSDTTLEISRSTLEQNTARAAGGGIYNGGLLTVDLCSITGNESTSAGGGIQNTGVIFVQDSTLKDNSSASDGGGLNTFGAATVIRSTFAGNAAKRGGGLASTGGNTALLNDTFSKNSASTGGGGIFNRNPDIMDLPATQLFASHITVVHNRAPTGGGLATGGGSLKIKNSIVALSASGGDCAGDLSAVAENLDSDDSCPGFTLKDDPLLGALADNGGPTQTHALQTDSPAIDAAPDCTTVAGLVVPFDQRGKSRPGGPFCDLGAYELVQETFQGTAPALTSTPTPLGGLTFTPTWVGDVTITPTWIGDVTITPTWIGDVTITPTWIGNVTITPTLVGPSVTALKNANCRYGPGTAYDIADTLFAGQTAPLVGRNELNTWWQIKGPTFGSLCWVSQVTVQVNGSTDGVPVGVAPPPPTLTPEPRPQQPKGCYVYDASGRQVCTVPCPANAQPGGSCKP